MVNLNKYNLMLLKKPLLDCLLHGSVLRRAERIEYQVHSFITKHLKNCYPKSILEL